MADELQNILRQFQCGGELVDAAPYGNGHIHDTYLVHCCFNGSRKNSLIMQRINIHVFSQPEQMMANIIRVTEHLLTKNNNRMIPSIPEVLEIIPTKTGEKFLVTPRGAYWRAYHYFPGTVTYQTPANNALVYETGRAFGTFISDLQDLPLESLHETIPDFHNTPKRYENFKDAVKNDPLGLATEVQPEIQFFQDREHFTNIITGQLGTEALPLRVTHNDCKINNVLMDAQTGQAICVVDLDTTMAGSLLYDFGEGVRTMTNTAAEDERDLSKVQFHFGYFDALVHGFLETTRDCLTATEVDLLPDAGILMTLENGMRFLTDYLQGDTYFKIHHPGHNLDRARTQIAFVKLLEKHRNYMEKSVKSLAN